MKKVTNLLAAATVAVAIFIGSSAKAQTITPDQFRFGIGVEGGLATGNLHNYSNLELGGTGRLQYGVSKNFALTLTSGYYNFFGRNVQGTDNSIKYNSLGMVPVKLGLKAFFTNNLYFGAEVGAGFETRAFGVVHGTNTQDYPKDNKLILSPALGYARKHYDIGVRYENYSGGGNNYGLVALRLAYGFGL